MNINILEWLNWRNKCFPSSSIQIFVLACNSRVILLYFMCFIEVGFVFKWFIEFLIWLSYFLISKKEVILSRKKSYPFFIYLLHLCIHPLKFQSHHHMHNTSFCLNMYQIVYDETEIARLCLEDLLCSKEH